MADLGSVNRTLVFTGPGNARPASQQESSAAGRTGVTTSLTGASRIGLAWPAKAESILAMVIVAVETASELKTEARLRRSLTQPTQLSRCGMNIVRHLHAPPAFRNSVIGSGWQV